MAVGVGGETTKRGEREGGVAGSAKERLWEVFRRACALEGRIVGGGGCFWGGARGRLGSTWNGMIK